jgi:hypothetical protein
LADEPGCYVHYLPTHGPNLWDRTAHRNDNDAPVAMRGVLRPHGAVGFPEPFDAPVEVRFDGDTVVDVSILSAKAWADALRESLMGARLIELGCGFQPKAPRNVIYPAGSNAPGALHFGVDLRSPSRWLRRMLPDWEEPPVHIDLVVHDATVMAGSTTLIDRGYLRALEAPSVVEMAKRFGDPCELLAGVDR